MDIPFGNDTQRAPEESHTIEAQIDFSSDDASEADEVIDEVDGNDPDAEEEEGEDLFGDDMMNDYRPVDPELDRYDASLLDENAQPDLTEAGKRRAEQAMRVRDAAARQADTTQQPRRRADRYYNIGQLLEDDGMADDHEEARVHRRRARRAQIFEKGRDRRPRPEDAKTALDELPFYDPMLEWRDAFGECLKVVFADFIWRFTNQVEDAIDEKDGPPVGIYVETLVNVVREEEKSLLVVYQHLESEYLKISEWFSFQPMRLFDLFDDVVNDIVETLYGDLYKHRRIRVRMKDFASYVEPMTSLGVQHLNQLVACEGVVVRRSGILPKVRKLFLQCGKCSHVLGPLDIKEDAFTTVKTRRSCGNCDNSEKWSICREKTLFQTLQFLTLQELPSAISQGRAPVQLEVLVDADLVDIARPGDHVMVLAHHEAKRNATLNSRAGFPVLTTTLVANNVIRQSEAKMSDLTEEDIAMFYKLAKCPNVREKIINSIAPSIWGHRHAKTGLAMAIFGGVRQEFQGQHSQHSIRGDVNVLLIGDPGMAKSQMLKYVNKVMDKSVYTTGKGASAAGLTASLKKDPVTGEYSLEGGALVLADTGICLIDEFDKMSEMDRVSIHEAMEAQTISISKAGIVTTLRARCSVIAAANPIYGTYDPSLTFSENVNLGDTIVSRFDVVAVMKDQATAVHDRHMADYITTTHRTSHPDHARERRLGLSDDLGIGGSGDRDPKDFIDGNRLIPHEFLAKYIMYARRFIKPQMTANERQKISEFYAQVRQAAIRTGGLPLTVRHLESILRMSIANAKMRLSSGVKREDIDYAISTMLESFIQSQKSVVAQSLSKKFGVYRALANNPFDMLETQVSEALAKQNQQTLQRRIQSRDQGMSGHLETDDVDAVTEASMPVDELIQLSKAMSDIPENVVRAYLESTKFKEKFRLANLEKDGAAIYAKTAPDDDDVDLDYIGGGTQVDTQEAL